MAVRRYYRDAPKQNPVVDQRGQITLSWSQFISDMQRPSNATDVDAGYDPPNLAPGAIVRANVPAPGARRGNFVSASHDGITQDVSVIAWASADDVITVKFQNESAGAVDLPAGTLRVRFWSHNP